MSRDELRNGYWNLVKRLYAPEAFLDRYFKTFESTEFLERRAEICRKAGEGKTLPTLGYGLMLLWALFWALLRDGSLFSVGRIYWKYYFTRNQQARPRHYRLRSVYEPLRDSLALLQVHPARQFPAGLRTYNSG